MEEYANRKLPRETGEREGRPSSPEGSRPFYSTSSRCISWNPSNTLALAPLDGKSTAGGISLPRACSTSWRAGLNSQYAGIIKVHTSSSRHADPIPRQSLTIHVQSLLQTLPQRARWKQAPPLGVGPGTRRWCASKAARQHYRVKSSQAASNQPANHHTSQRTTTVGLGDAWHTGSASTSYFLAHVTLPPAGSMMQPKCVHSFVVGYAWNHLCNSE